MTAQKLKKVVKISTVCVSIFVVLMVCIIAYQCIKIGTLQAKSRQLDKLSASLTSQQATLQDGISIRSTDGYLQQAAREQYGLVKDGETLYVFGADFGQ